MHRGRQKWQHRLFLYEQIKKIKKSKSRDWFCKYYLFVCSNYYIIQAWFRKVTCCRSCLIVISSLVKHVIPGWKVRNEKNHERHGYIDGRVDRKMDGWMFFRASCRAVWGFIPPSLAFPQWCHQLKGHDTQTSIFMFRLYSHRDKYGSDWHHVRAKKNAGTHPNSSLTGRETIVCVYTCLSVCVCVWRMCFWVYYTKTIYTSEPAGHISPPEQ